MYGSGYMEGTFQDAQAAEHAELAAIKRDFAKVSTLLRKGHTHKELAVTWLLCL